MVCEIHCVFILATAPVIFGFKLQVDGKMDFGPKWNYEYRIKPLETNMDDPIHKFTALANSNMGYVRTQQPPKFVDIIIKNHKLNPRLIQVAEAQLFDRKNKKEQDMEAGRDTDIIKNMKNHVKKEPLRTTPIKFSDEHTDTPKIRNKEKLTDVGKYVHELVKTVGDLDPKPIELEEFKVPLLSEEDSHRATIMKYSDIKRHKHHRMETKENKETFVNDFENRAIPAAKYVQSYAIEPLEKKVVQEMYVEPRLVKDDPMIKEFTRHLYEQSLKTLQSIKDKINSYEMKKEANKLMRSYEDKFGEFVRETQNQKIKTRLGRQKVILNTLDTSNRILDRLVNYMIGRMETKGILRHSGTENVIINEVNKKKDLENKHLCAKMQICPHSETFTKFVVDILGTILSSADNKILEMRDACTEVVKNYDFSNYLDVDKETKFLKKIDNLEKFGVGAIKPLFSMIKNILSSKNTPIKVVGKEDVRVNKTLAILEIANSLDTLLPPNEANTLEWNDMKNSFKEWKLGNRKDTLDLVQHFTDHVVQAVSEKDTRVFDKNLKIILGF